MGTKRVSVTVKFEEDGKERVASFDSSTGCALSVDGVLYPAEVGMVSKMIAAVRAEKDNFHPRGQEPAPSV